MALIERDFGSLDAFKKELLNTGKVPPVGWAVWALAAIDKRTHVFAIEQHMNQVPFCVPLLVLDVFEHAYMIDYGTARAAYLEDFWENINWNTVEARLEALP
ncbi:MAG: Fe-Mn family superoxide dismutase [Polyangiaceae bacterium]|nr:Fe-Mn family superoxide dismutase [Polyangiaceae bacterium]